MNNIINDNFFYIDSNNVNEIKDRLYGYIIVNKNNKINLLSSVDDLDIHANNILNGEYIFIKKDQNNINIYCDDFSTFYIYYYQGQNFFAISNSFYILLENLKKKDISNNIILTPNKIVIDEYIQSGLRTYAIYDTLIKEINIVPIFTNIKISNNHIHFIKKEIELDYINILSREGIFILDKWIDKYANIIHSLLNTNYQTQIDLSGGFDSRVIFSLIHYSNIDWNKDNIHIYSKIGDNKGMIKHLSNDYDIATEIVNKLNLKIDTNKNYNIQSVGYSGQQMYSLLKNIFMGVHKEGYYCCKNYNEPFLHFGGINGEIIRGAYTDLDEIKKYFLSVNPIRNSVEVYNKLNNDFNNILRESSSRYSALQKMYLATLSKSHFGMSIYNAFIANMYNLSPFNDKDLLRLHIPDGYKKDLLFALIIYRTTPELFDIKFTNDKDFDDNVKAVCIEISNKYPKQQINFTNNDIFIQDAYKYNYEIEKDNLVGDDILYQVFKENKDLFINEMSKLFDKEYAIKLYDYADQFYLNKDNFYPNKWITCLTSIIEVFKILNNTNE